MTLETKPGKGRYSKHGHNVFSEKGKYTLVTILKGEQAVSTTLAIIETCAQVRAMVRDMEDADAKVCQLSDENDMI